MSQKKTGKLALNPETLRQLVDLDEVNGAAGERADGSVIVQISKNNTGKGSWFLCCKDA